MIDLSLVEKNHGNERDIEIAGVLTLYEKYRKNIRTMLDVGARDSSRTYAPALRALAGKEVIYDGIDIAPDMGGIGEYVDKYLIGNVTDLAQHYDFVFSISSLEHSGLSTYKVDDWRKERKRVLLKVHELADKYLFITVPYGLENVIEGQYANFTKEDLDWFLDQLPEGHKAQVKFYFCEKLGDPYQEIPWEQADNTPFDNTGVRCNLFLFIDKT